MSGRPPRLDEDVQVADAKMTKSATSPDANTVPCLVVVRGASLGATFYVHRNETLIGRGTDCDVVIDSNGVSRLHARLVRHADGIDIEDMSSAQGTHLGGQRVYGRKRVHDGDQLQLGPDCVIMLTFQTTSAALGDGAERTSSAWTLDSWRTRPTQQQVEYEDPAELEEVVRKLRTLPPLVTSWEVERLKSLIADAQLGKRFFLQGGDCAETFGDCNPSVITNKLKILLQMSLVLVPGARRPIIRVGRLAGQYAKPRSKPTETRNGVELRSYLGDLVNRPGFTPADRRADPQLLLKGYHHSAMTLNFMRALGQGGFADLRHPEYFDLSFFERADLPSQLKAEYQRTAKRIAEGLEFMKVLGDQMLDDLWKVEFFTSHEGLHLEYESAQTRTVPRRSAHYDLTTHLPWIGDRTRLLDGGHVEFFRGIANPIGVKLGPNTTPAEVVELCKVLNPYDEPGKMVFIVRMGAKAVAEKLPPLIEIIQRKRRRVLWVSDPMHGNMITVNGIKTRNFDDILGEIRTSFDVHDALGTTLGGVHFELAGEDVTECIGGGISEADLDTNYLSACDPRLNYRQAMEMAFAICRRMAETALSPTAL